MTEEIAPYNANEQEHKDLPHDEGPTYLGVGTKDGHVMIEFTRPIKWLGMRPGDARRLAASLIKFSDAIDRIGKNGTTTITVIAPPAPPVEPREAEENV